MAISLNPKNEKSLNLAIDLAQGKARERRIDLDDIYAIIIDIENRLNSLNIPKGAQVGARFHFANQFKFAGSYKWTPESTQFIIEKTRSGWKLIDVFRGGCKGTKKIVFLNEHNFKHHYKF